MSYKIKQPFTSVQEAYTESDVTGLYNKMLGTEPADIANSDYDPKKQARYDMNPDGELQYNPVTGANFQPNLRDIMLDDSMQRFQQTQNIMSMTAIAGVSLAIITYMVSTYNNSV